MRITSKFLTRATDKQINFINILANDLGFNIERRNAHISDIVGYTIKSLDSLTITDANKVIEKFKIWRDGEDECQ